jgi:hypothetical protein
MRAPTLTPGQLLLELDRRGLQLGSDGPGRLVFWNRPHPVLTEELVTNLNAWRPMLLEVLRHTGKDRLPPIGGVATMRAV